MTLEPGQMLLHYRLLAPLGSGGMGVVWRALDTSLDREVAIKLLPEAVASDPALLARFEREAKLLASVNHPNIAAVYGLHAVDGVRFLAMELIRGRTLTREIAGGIAHARVVELAITIADALAAAHRQHVTHRDLKPDNIMLDGEGRPKVLDFGLAKHGFHDAGPDAPTSNFEATLTREGSLLGTVAYMSPEQAQGKPVDPRSDVFSLGILLYELTTGRRPFDGDNAISILTSILRDVPVPITTLTPSASPELDRIVRRCLEKQPDARYPDAAALRDDLCALRDSAVRESWIRDSSPPASALPQPIGAPRATRGRWFAAAIALAALVALALPGTWWYRHAARDRWVRYEALPQLQRTVDHIQGLEEGRESWDAYVLARRIDEAASGDPLVKLLRPKFTREMSIRSEPPGATVYARFYDEPDAAPVLIGRTPLEKVGYPRGITRIELTLPGKRAIEDVIWNSALVSDSVSYRFVDGLPEEMSWVPPGSFALFMPGLDHLAPEPTAAFLVDRHEVTNREYKQFVDAGGYTDPKYWRQPFIDGDRTLPFDDAIKRFVDRTGRRGPATWEVGTYASGHEDYPVSGVSWYEAAAYAEWAGKSLPTIFHWNRFAFPLGSSRIVPLANLAGTGPVPVGSRRSSNRWGTTDCAGNVREWTWNSNKRGREHFILGGGWNDPDYAFNDAYAQPAFDRSPTNGFRCIRYAGNEPNLARLQREVTTPYRDFRAEKPVPDAVFAQYVRQFAYDRVPLDAKIEEEKQTPHGRRQKITFNAAYGGERMLAYLFLPAGGAKPPYQVVVLFPGSGSIDIRSSATLDLGRVDFLTTSGRAVLFPIYKGTYERGGDLHSDLPEPTTKYKDYVVMWGKDVSRSIDYLETRSDIDTKRLAYYGVSWGAELGAIFPAVEPRIKVNVLYVAGFCLQHALPEVDAINYVTRVKQPTLMLNGELDFFFPSETSQKPMFELLGTAPADKKRLVFPGGHSVPRVDMIKESLEWLDRYLGPV